MFTPAHFQELVRMPRTLPVVPVSGPPVAGKDGIIEAIKAHRGDIADVVGEVATAVMTNTACRPYPTREDSLVFQSGVFFTQLMFEQLAQHAALKAKKSVIVTNRGAADGPAYVKSRQAFEDLVGMSMKEIHALYPGVIFVEMSSRKIYEENVRRNPTRYETSYEDACDTGDLLLELGWGDHHNIVFVKANDDWLALEHDALNAFDKITGR